MQRTQWSNFDFKLEGIIKKKKSYERRAYAWVGWRCEPTLGYMSKNEKKKRIRVFKG